MPDIDALAEALAALLKDPACRASMGARARATYEERFTFERMYQRYLEEYRALVGDRETARA